MAVCHHGKQTLYGKLSCFKKTFLYIFITVSSITSISCISNTEIYKFYISTSLTHCQSVCVTECTAVVTHVCCATSCILPLPQHSPGGATVYQSNVCHCKAAHMDDATAGLPEDCL